MSKAISKYIERRALLKGTALASVAMAVPRFPALAAAAGDRTLIETEIEITQLYAWLDANPDADDDLERNPVYEHIYELEDVIAEAPTTSLSDATVKLRRLLDREVGIEPNGVNDIPVLLSVLALLHSITGEPTHPTRPLYTAQDCGEKGEEI
jgi:hypothetical protein